jgi:polysaccharide export outer membrane protein
MMRLSVSFVFLTATFALLPASFAQQYPQPAEPGANLPAQPVGPNDLLSISVYEAPEFSRTVRVGTDGFFRLPMLKQRVKAQGLFPADIETAIARGLKEEEILVDPFVTVTIAEYHSRPISVNGAVKMPLVFQADGPITLLDALARAQGLREDAGRDILVSRLQPGPDQEVVMLTRRVPVRSLIDEADPAFNLKLNGGEEVRVPEVGRIYVVGNVKKPGAFAVKDGADTTVLQMIALAEGLAPYYRKEAYIYRQEGGGGKNEIPVPLDKIMERKAPDVPLAANDILYIPDNKGRRLTLGALEKITGVSTAMGAAAIYVWR